MAREGVPLNVIQRQLGHANLGITSVYLQGIDNAEIIDTVHWRRAPMIPPAPACANLDSAPRDAAARQHVKERSAIEPCERSLCRFYVKKLIGRGSVLWSGWGGWSRSQMRRAR